MVCCAGEGERVRTLWVEEEDELVVVLEDGGMAAEEISRRKRKRRGKVAGTWQVVGRFANWMKCG